MIDLDHERDLVGVLPTHHGQNAKRGSDGIATGFDGQFDDLFGIEIDGIGRKGGSGTVFNPLVHRKDGQVARATHAAMVEEGLQTPQDLIAPIALAVDPVDKIGSGCMQHGSVDGGTLMIQEIIGLVTQELEQVGICHDV